MRIFCLILAVLLFFSSCYSTPHVKGSVKVDEGKYNIIISKDYAVVPQELKYAVNNFVRDSLNEDSYDVKTEKRGSGYDYIVLVPGSQQVEDLPEVKHFHKGKTAMAIAIPAYAAYEAMNIAIVIVIYALMFSAIFSFAPASSSH